MRVVKLIHDAKYGFTRAAPPEEGWCIPLNLRVESEISLTVAYREDKTMENLKSLAYKVFTMAGWQPGERTFDKYIVYLYFRETYKNLADGLPPISSSEKKEQDKRRQKAAEEAG